MHSRRELWVLGGVVLVIVALALLTTRGERGRAAFDPRPSTYVSGPFGARALIETLRELKLPVARRMEPFADAGKLQGPLAVLAPSMDPSEGEVHALAEWVREGGTLIYASRASGGWRDREIALDTLGLGLVPVARDTLVMALDLRGVGAVATTEPHRLTEGVGTVEGFRRGFSRGSRALGKATVLASTGGTPVVVDFRVGKGRVIAWSDALPLVNGRLKTSRAALLFARTAADAASGRPVVFDEYHHGFETGSGVMGGTLRFLLSERWGHAALQVTVALLGLLLLFGRRFGAPLPPPPVRRRSPLEHVEALAGAYQKAGARDTARRLLLAGMARRLGRRVAHTPAAEHELIQRLGAHPTAGEAARGLEREWMKGRGANLLALSREVDRTIEEVKRT
ncbi:MAG TPA: DUF4350 domain-containing protein [Longimicrobium sp.]|nr:DUF4350 domain-containing protein [Longimicrobium sp.]